MIMCRFCLIICRLLDDSNFEVARCVKGRLLGLFHIGCKVAQCVNEKLLG